VEAASKVRSVMVLERGEKRSRRERKHTWDKQVPPFFVPLPPPFSSLTTLSPLPPFLPPPNTCCRLRLLHFKVYPVLAAELYYDMSDWCIDSQKYDPNLWMKLRAGTQAFLLGGPLL